MPTHTTLSSLMDMKTGMYLPRARMLSPTTAMMQATTQASHAMFDVPLGARGWERRLSASVDRGPLLAATVARSRARIMLCALLDAVAAHVLQFQL